MLVGIVLAAGLGKRMNSKRHKVVHEVCGKSMIEHIVDEMLAVGFDRLFVVVGKLEEQVRAVLGDRVEYIRQTEQLGTGHAVMMAAPYLPEQGTAVVLYGDCPLVRREEITRLLQAVKDDAGTAVQTAVVDNPFAYGRILRDARGDVSRIVEEKDASTEQRQIREVNSGIYAFSIPSLRASLEKLSRDNAQGEYLLTDCIEHIRRTGERIFPVVVVDPDDIANVNDRVQLSYVEEKLRKRILLKHMQNGVTILDPAATYIQADVSIGRDTVLMPGTILEGKTTLGEDCVIGPNTRIKDAVIGDSVTIESSVILTSSIADRAAVGPFAYVRPGSSIGSDTKIGDFVEIKNAVIGEGTKVSHLAYVGDSDVGKGVNMGCGVVTVNYDGFGKHRTVIGDNSFVGSNVNLIAPVTVGAGGYIATGSTITDDVPEQAFAIARERQTTKPDYANHLRLRLKDLHDSSAGRSSVKE